MSQVVWLFIVSFTLVGLTGCTTTRNGFSQFYRDYAGPNITNLLPYSGNTEIIPTSNPTNDIRNWERKGYAVIGESAFSGSPQSQGALMSQAKKVGADVVLSAFAYLGSHQANVPWIQYHSGQTYTTMNSGTFNAWGSAGNAWGNYQGTSTTTTPGTFSTELIPVTVHRCQYDAIFFRKRKLPILGVLAAPLSPEIQQRLERNTGLFVFAVMQGSPAFNGNVLEGDVILKMNGEDINSPLEYQEKLQKLAGQKIQLEIWRNGQFKTIAVQLNKKP